MGTVIKSRAEKRKIRRSRSDVIFDCINYGILAAVGLCVMYPLYFIVIASVSDPVAINAGRLSFFPIGFNLDGYRKIFQEEQIWTAYANTIFYTVVGTAVNIIGTMLIAYPLSRKNFFARKFLTAFIMFTIYFQGGMIPTYLLVQSLGLYNNRWVMILLPAINVFNVIIARTNIQSNIPDELYDAACIDGCSHFKFFTAIVMPLSMSIIAVLVLYYGVAHWNEFMNGMIYLQDQDKLPLQVILRNIMLQNQVSGLDDIDSMLEQQKAAELLKYGLIIVSTVPVLLVYPFVQKHFAKGVMVGSVKG